MAVYVRRPIQVEAVEWTGSIRDLDLFTHGNHKWDQVNNEVEVPTPTGWMKLEKGMFITKELGDVRPEMFGPMPGEHFHLLYRSTMDPADFDVIADAVVETHPHPTPEESKLIRNSAIVALEIAHDLEN